MKQATKRRKQGTFGSFVALFLALILVAAACGSDDDGDEEASGGDQTSSTAAAAGSTTTAAAAEEPAERITMRVGMQQNNFATIPLTLADDLGFFDDEGIDIELTIGEAGATITAGLIGGSFEIQIGGTEMVLAREQGGPVIAVAALNNAPVWSLIAAAEYTTVESLRGATFGVSAPDGIDVLILALGLESAGIGLDEIEMVTTGGTTARYGAVQQGLTDATSVASPFEFIAEGAGLTNLGGLVELEPNFTSALLATSEQYAAESPDELVRFLRAYIRGMEWIHDPANEADLVERVARITELEPSVVQQAYTYWIGGEFADLMFPPDAHIDMESLQNVVDKYLEEGILTETPDLEAFVVDDFREEAEGSL